MGDFSQGVFTLRARTSSPLCGTFTPFSTTHSLCLCEKSNLFVFNGRLSYSACIKVLSAALGRQRWAPHGGHRRRTWNQQGKLRWSNDSKKCDTLCSVVALTHNLQGSDFEKVSRSSRFLQKRTQIISIITIVIIIVILIGIQPKFLCINCKQTW